MLPLRTSRDGRVVVATFENPPHQLLDAAGVAALADLVAEVERDEGVGAVVLTGAHPERFLAHYDIAALRESAQTPGGVALSPPVAGAALRATGLLRRIPVAGEALTRTPASGLVELQRFHDALLGMQRSPATWIAALNGSAQGGGFEIALACDLRLAADDDALLLGVPEVALGFAPTAGSSQRLPRLIGASLAIELVLEGRPLSPREALEYGLVHHLHPREALLDEALTTARRLATRPRAAVAAAKRLVYESAALPLPQGLAAERAAATATLATDEARARLDAYVRRTDELGELPLYDATARRELLDGR